jgi:hypothetical protein
MARRNRGLGMNPSRSEAETKMDQTDNGAGLSSGYGGGFANRVGDIVNVDNLAMRHLDAARVGAMTWVLLVS